MLAHDDTIAAIATPPGAGGIGIVRISGPGSEDVCQVLFRPKSTAGPLKSHHFYHGDIVSSANGNAIDEVLVVLMRAPNSYTGEDVLEIHCHGGNLILHAVLTEAIMKGCRLADRGEFTKRAYLNGRMDLLQAEAVMDLITARTDRGREIALAGLKGNLSEKIQSIRSDLIEILSFLESSIDFSEEEISSPEFSRPHWQEIEGILASINGILETYREGKLFRDGFNVVITGRPNVGKSSLLNRLLGERRAIVTSVPGTTRDFIEETVNINGIPVLLTDTAGIRKFPEEVEREGIALVWEKTLMADMVIVLVDGSTPLTEEDVEVIDKNRKKPLILAVNKSDLTHQIPDKHISEVFPGISAVWISAKYGEGIEALKEKIKAMALDNEDYSTSDLLLTNLRHKSALQKAASSLLAAQSGILNGNSAELTAFELKESLDHLGSIAGDTTSEDILDKIFSTFCVGK